MNTINGNFIEKSIPDTKNATLAINIGGVDATITVEKFAAATASPGGLAGTNYIYLMANGTDVENAAKLSAAYTTAQSMSPSATNRITIIAAPGKYNFNSSPFVMNTQYIDLVSLDGNRSVIFNSANSAGTISITTNDVFVKGVSVETKNFTIATNLNLLKIENCIGGNSSFGGTIIVSGTFINCQGGQDSFGGNNGTASGIFTNCVGGFASFGGYSSFGGTGAASGTFNNCTGDSFSFGAQVTASGTFRNCIGGSFAFGGLGNANGTFTNCVGDDSSFGGTIKGVGTLTGKLYYCRIITGTFNTVSGGGITRLCLDGNNTENNQG